MSEQRDTTKDRGLEDELNADYTAAWYAKAVRGLQAEDRREVEGEKRG